jgi:hypothetical protein
MGVGVNASRLTLEMAQGMINCAGLYQTAATVLAALQVERPDLANQVEVSDEIRQAAEQIEIDRGQAWDQLNIAAKFAPGDNALEQ